MAQTPHLEGLATQILQFSDESQRNAQSFVLSLGTDAAGAQDETAQVSLGPLKFFCDADTTLKGFEDQISGLLAEPHLPADERRLLTDTKSCSGVIAK